MKKRSYTIRVLIGSWVLVLVALSSFFLIATDSMNADLLDEAQTRAKSELNAVTWLLAEHPPFTTDQALDDWATKLGDKLGIRITFVREDGSVAADTLVRYGDLAMLDNHASRPEIMAARSSDTGISMRHSATLGRDMIYIATRFEASNDLPAGFLRLAVPQSAVGDRVSKLRSNFLWALFAILAGSAVLLIFAARTMNRSLKSFAALATDIGAGNYDRRIRSYPGGEFRALAEAINAMAEKIGQHIRKIDDQRGQLKAIFEGMNEGVMVLNQTGRIETFNHAAAGMFSMDDGAIGQTPLEALRMIEIQNALEEQAADPLGQTRRIELDSTEDRFIEASVVPFLDDKGVRKTILVFHDVTAQRKEEKALREFVANVSHQMLTPLTSIIGYGETLVDTPPEDAGTAKHFMETILNNARHMSRVVSSMLALAKSEQVGERIPKAALPARQAIEMVLSTLTPLAEEKNLTFIQNVTDQAPDVMAEETGLRHIFQNLVHNAIKHSPQDGVITISFTERDNMIEFCVADQGPGVSRRESEKVFDRFYRVDPNRIDADGSAGLGLAICRQIVRNFGGEIWCEPNTTENGGGARFCFALTKA